MQGPDLKVRTKQFALRVIRLSQALPRTPAADVISRQALRSATSVGANYRAARRARSARDFLNKLCMVEEEADETGYWLELLAEANLIDGTLLTDLIRECDEITAIVVASIRTARRNHKAGQARATSRPSP